MPNRESVLSGVLHSPTRILAIILILVFSTEVVVMLLLPHVLPDVMGEIGEAFFDAILLTLVCAPVLWFVISAAKRAEQRRVSMVREQEALKAQQMATLAQLATGVAHEIRNPLTSIKLLIQVNRSKLSEKGLPVDDLELVEQEIRRMERSINSLLDYARPDQTQFATTSLSSIIRSVAHLIEGRCDAQGVDLRIDIPESAANIVGDSGQLQQLLLNLVLNSLDAMPDGGTLSVRLQESTDIYELAVEDTGCGISDEIREKLFQPFVTTKDNGVGLGLGICQRIAESHRGSLQGQNLTGHGAEFRLVLPKQPDFSGDHQEVDSDGLAEQIGRGAACDAC